ncbi:MAG: pilus assembly protein [Bryobacterales bacterium]|nr:pilus assembly protein [Acidobacteriota bacterium]MCB9384219.1 pilus assembly protein [Bryobacterales bacterium]
MFRRPKFSPALNCRRGNAVAELALCMPVLVFALLGVVSGGLVFDRYMTVVQLSRNAASMYSRGTNFALDDNKDLLLLGQELSITRNGGDGVIYLTRVVLAPAGTANEGQLVVAERHLIGNPAFAASAVGQPNPSIWPNPDKPAPTGEVKDYFQDPSAVATVPAALMTLPLGESMYIAEVYHSSDGLRFGDVWRDTGRMSAVAYF